MILVLNVDVTKWAIFEFIFYIQITVFDMPLGDGDLCILSYL